MSVYRGGVNITKMPDAKLKALVNAALNRGADFQELKESAGRLASLVRCRKWVAMGACAVELVAHAMIVTTRIAPSPESINWSNLEGGHTFHQSPDESEVIALLLGERDTIETFTTSGG